MPLRHVVASAAVALGVLAACGGSDAGIIKYEFSGVDWFNNNSTSYWTLSPFRIDSYGYTSTVATCSYPGQCGVIIQANPVFLSTLTVSGLGVFPISNPSYVYTELSFPFAGPEAVKFGSVAPGGTGYGTDVFGISENIAPDLTAPFGPAGLSTLPGFDLAPTGLPNLLAANPWGDLFSATLVAGVPEPATWAMLILGVAMVGLVARRRRTGVTAAA